MILDHKIIGKRIQEFRLAKCLSQEKLAEMSNLSVGYISLIENNYKNKKPSLEVLFNLGNILGVTIDTFLMGCQKNDEIIHKTYLTSLIEDCNNYERQMICDAARDMKKSVRSNSCLYSK